MVHIPKLGALPYKTPEWTVVKVHAARTKKPRWYPRPRTFKMVGRMKYVFYTFGRSKPRWRAGRDKPEFMSLGKGAHPTFDYSSWRGFKKGLLAPPTGNKILFETNELHLFTWVYDLEARLALQSNK